jgi:hypothetical protein
MPQAMPMKRLSPRLPVLICALGLSLSGCVAVPLVEMAISQAPSADRACSGCATNPTASPLANLSKGVSDSFHKLTGAAPTEVTAK